MKFKEKTYVGNQSELRIQIITHIHQFNLWGHSGVQGTFLRIQLTFLWPGLTQQVNEVISKCPICQINKPEHVKSPGLLQPLPVPEQACVGIASEK